MKAKPARGLFITGTDTGVGKTYVAALIARALVAAGRNVGVYKPAASGCRREGEMLVSDDAVALWHAAGKPGRLADVCPQRFAAPLAPHLAARAEGRELDEAQLRTGLEAWSEYDFVIVEGAGGLMSPLGDEDYVADLASEFAYPLVVVAPNRLGVVNQTLQTLITAATFRDGLPVAGIILNEIFPAEHHDPSRATNGAELAARSIPPLLAHVPWLASELPGPLDWLQFGQNR
jgi:dethiobiotin synthetase